MKVQCYAIFDTCSGIYEKPFFSTADDLVRREFQDVCTSADHPISKHPEHYSLWRLGIFDNTTGKITDERNECLWQGVEAISQSQAVNPERLHDLDAEVERDGKPQYQDKLNGPGAKPLNNPTGYNDE